MYCDLETISGFISFVAERVSSIHSGDYAARGK